MHSSFPLPLLLLPIAFPSSSISSSPPLLSSSSTLPQPFTFPSLVTSPISSLSYSLRSSYSSSSSSPPLLLLIVFSFLALCLPYPTLTGLPPPPPSRLNPPLLRITRGSDRRSGRKPTEASRRRCGGHVLIRIWEGMGGEGAKGRSTRKYGCGNDLPTAPSGTLMTFLMINT